MHKYFAQNGPEKRHYNKSDIKYSNRTKSVKFKPKTNITTNMTLFGKTINKPEQSNPFKTVKTK